MGSLGMGILGGQSIRRPSRRMQKPFRARAETRLMHPYSESPRPWRNRLLLSRRRARIRVYRLLLRRHVPRRRPHRRRGWRHPRRLGLLPRGPRVPQVQSALRVWVGPARFRLPSFSGRWPRRWSSPARHRRFRPHKPRPRRRFPLRPNHRRLPRLRRRWRAFSSHPGWRARQVRRHLPARRSGPARHRQRRHRWPHRHRVLRCPRRCRCHRHHHRLLPRRWRQHPPPPRRRRPLLPPRLRVRPHRSRCRRPGLNVRPWSRRPPRVGCGAKPVVIRFCWRSGSQPRSMRYR